MPKLGCAVSKTTSFGLQAAHLIPPIESLWYSQNCMASYETFDFQDPDRWVTGVQNARNCLKMRMDICSVFNQAWFAIVPKFDNESTGFQWVIHTLSPDAGEFWSRYHNHVVDELDSNSRPYLFARFAWAIFQRVELSRARREREQAAHTEEKLSLLKRLAAMENPDWSELLR
ncbi:hypothetical protein CONLIGDRAFT_684671 [Coniochaeta ligniaria NRRL 30616]|uniref:Uncharacterized protein n=1 Tax=Coniochaeta ligniaria NRRL 30616 TaxID=1408157 RepID=A0A1J7IFA5_9PEZI|nr:hypothetical protein CONLIGDRAFT_684671 [Coniochaeta ligniaria NRRL 30616]